VGVSPQVIIVPCGITANLADDERRSLHGKCGELEEVLKRSGISAKTDLRDNYSPGWKFNHWELKVVMRKNCVEGSHA